MDVRKQRRKQACQISHVHFDGIAHLVEVTSNIYFHEPMQLVRTCLWIGLLSGMEVDSHQCLAGY